MESTVEWIRNARKAAGLSQAHDARRIIKFHARRRPGTIPASHGRAPETPIDIVNEVKLTIPRDVTAFVHNYKIRG